MSTPLLEIRNLHLDFPGGSGGAVAKRLCGVDLVVESGESVALVGPSGCGKSLTARAVCGLFPRGARWSGSILWQGEPLTDPWGEAWRSLRGGGMTLVLQEPKTSLNPVLRVGDQIAEAVRIHAGCSSAEARRKAVALLEEVRIPDAPGTSRRWPHELSGGMRQRALLAAALACAPRLLICDEPTTALDPTVQRDVLLLLDQVRRSRRMALLFITHDRNLVPLLADRAVHMRDGRIVAGEAAAPPVQDETRWRRPEAPQGRPVLEARALGFRYPAQVVRGGRWDAVEPLDLQLYAGRALGLAGESGCGKTTLAKVLSLHLRPFRGSLSLAGVGINPGAGEPSPGVRRGIQMVFQDPGQSLNPRQRIEAMLREAAGADADRSAVEMLAEVDLPVDVLRRFPHELSGGQKQRVALARCLACEPQVLIADEITSSLDDRTRNQVLGLLHEAMAARDLALLLIDHNLGTLHAFCDRVMVMYRGLVVEIYDPHSTAGPSHPYTLNLMAASPVVLGQDPQGLRSADPAPATAPGTDRPGCPWAPACVLRKDNCFNELPALESHGSGCFLRCPEVGR